MAAKAAPKGPGTRGAAKAAVKGRPRTLANFFLGPGGGPGLRLPEPEALGAEFAEKAAAWRSHPGAQGAHQLLKDRNLVVVQDEDGKQLERDRCLHRCIE